MGFTKLSDNLVFSSLMREDAETFRVFVVLLSLTGPDGIAPVSEDFLQTITRQSSDVIRRCLKRLASPDPTSRTPDHEGRRIRRVSGGYEILNYQRYREIPHKEGERERKRRERARKAKASGHVTDASASLSASASPSASEEGGVGGGVPTLDQVRKYCREIGSQVSPERFIDVNQARGWRIDGQPIADWRALLRSWGTNGRGEGADTSGIYYRPQHQDGKCDLNAEYSTGHRLFTDTNAG